MKKILITGASGMLGAALVSQWDKVFEIYATGNSSFSSNHAKRYLVFDLAQESYQNLVSFVKPDYIVHCAAITSHELCEKNPDLAYNVNGESVRKLLNSFPNAKLIYISTDAVFPPNTHLADEQTSLDPKSVYGKSKALGERYIQQSDNRGLVIRTTIVGKNINVKKSNSFAEWIVYSLKKNLAITLFADVMFTPISIWHLASELKWIIDNNMDMSGHKVLHIAGSEVVSKYDFAYKLARKLQIDTKKIKKGSIMGSDLIPKRNSDQTLNTILYHKLTGHTLPSVNKTISILVNKFR